MTPDKRLNQIEPILADVVQKVDRLIEGNGQIITEVSKIPGIERTGEITARGLADLTINVNKRFDQLHQDVDARFNEVDTRFDSVDTRFDGVDTRFDGVDTRFNSVDIRFNEVDARFNGVDIRFNDLQRDIDTRFNDMQQDIDTRFDYVNTRFDQLQQDVTEVKSDQQLILRILREKLL